VLDESFALRMRKILGDGADSFFSVLENGAAERGVRVNTIKATKESFLSSTALSLTPLSYNELGFILECDTPLGNLAEHHAGMIYAQDPGAMATLSALDIKEGWWVLDTCAAPGGKSTQAAAQITHSGFILSNEYEPKRAKTVVSNFERLGIRSGMVTSLDTSELSRMFSAVFDLVIADVPCSGEGMFRKNSNAVDMWSEQNVIFSAKRQRQILENVYSTVKAGGYLIYSTCTYSIEENEGVLSDFLRCHPDFKIIPAREELVAVTLDGISMCEGDGLNLARRFYPHVSRGEGQFVALLQRDTDIDVKPKILYKDATAQISREENLAIEKFFSSSLIKRPEGRIAKVGDNIVIIPHACPVPKRSVFCAGVLLGEVRKGTLFPSHHFFSAYGELFLRKEELAPTDSRLEKYLRGEEIDATVSDGYCVVTYFGSVLGGGKVSLGKIKNHYPKGLRNLK